MKIITIMSDIANSVLLASDNSPSGGPINHINIVKTSMNEITLLGHVSVEFERKRKTTYEILSNRENKGSTTTTTDTAQLGNFATGGMYS